MVGCPVTRAGRFTRRTQTRARRSRRIGASGKAEVLGIGKTTHNGNSKIKLFTFSDVDGCSFWNSMLVVLGSLRQLSAGMDFLLRDIRNEKRPALFIGQGPAFNAGANPQNVLSPSRLAASFGSSNFKLPLRLPLVIGRRVASVRGAESH